MSRARSVSQLVGANTALGNTTVSGALTVSTNTATIGSNFFAVSNGNIGFGNSNPTEAVRFNANTQFGRNTYIGSSATGGPISVGTSGGSQIQFVQNGADDELAFITHYSGVSHRESMRIDRSGRVTMPYQPAFMAVVPTEKSLTGGADNDLTSHFTSTTYNVGGHFSTSNGRFTAPVAGLYHFVADLYVYTCSTCEIYLKINGSTYIRTWDKGQGLNTNPSGNHRSYQLSLSAGDYITLSAVPNQNAALWNGGPYSSRFTGCLIR